MGLTGFTIDLPGTYPDRAQGTLIRCIICLCDTRTVIIMKYELEAALALAGPSALLCSFSSAAMTAHSGTATCQCNVSPCTRETVPLQMQLKCCPNCGCPMERSETMATGCQTPLLRPAYTSIVRAAAICSVKRTYSLLSRESAGTLDWCLP